jgi:DNA-binding MarR family transcriptional regulator
MEQPAPRTAPAEAAPDRETAAGTQDHHALRLWLRLLTCTQLVEQQVRARLRERFDTTLPRFDLMSALWRYPAGLKMNELGRHLMVTGGNVTGIVDPLEKEGLVERADDPADRRAWRVRLTRGGRKAFAEMARVHEEWIVELLAGLSRREHAELYKLLGRLKRATLEAQS